MSVPHPIDRTEGEGCNALIDQGTQPYLSISSLQLKTAPTPTETAATSYSSPGKKSKSPILQAIQDGYQTIPELAAKLQMNESKLTETLFSLEMDGHIYLRGDLIQIT